MSAPFYIASGDTVRVSGWLGGMLMLVGEHIRDGYFRLTFAHNGNEAPGAYHEGLLERVA